MGDLINKIKQMWNTPDDEYDYDDNKNEEYDYSKDFDYDYSKENSESTTSPSEEYYPDEPSPAPAPYTPSIPYISTPPAPSSNNNVMNIDATTKLQVVVFRPDRFSDETRTIADELIRQHTIVLNLENANKDNSRRIIDFMSGAAYATGGKIKRVATSTFLVIPNTVHMTGDDLLAQLESNGVIV